LAKTKWAENRESRDGPCFREESFDSLARRPTVITVDPRAAQLPFVIRYASFILILISIQLDNV
jgi:hypothetical protein